VALRRRRTVFWHTLNMIDRIYNVNTVMASTTADQFRRTGSDRNPRKRARGERTGGPSGS
jgi:hypothetical protein